MGPPPGDGLYLSWFGKLGDSEVLGRKREQGGMGEREELAGESN